MYSNQLNYRTSLPVFLKRGCKDTAFFETSKHSRDFFSFFLSYAKKTERHPTFTVEKQEVFVNLDKRVEAQFIEPHHLQIRLLNPH